jgi:F-type H+-transporting ATPase subunit delta
MLKGAIARRYAGAIFELARKQNTLDRTLEDVKEIARLFSIRKLAYLLREPKVSLQRKEAALRQALSSRVLPPSLNLALLIVERQLVDLMPNIAAELEQLVLDYKNEAIAQVTTAKPMDNKQRALVEQALERKTGKKIIMQPRVDPSILGGVIARVRDQVIDGSVRYRLNALRQHLLTSVASANVDFSLPEEITEASSGEYHAPPEMASGEKTASDTKPRAYRS